MVRVGIVLGGGGIVGQSYHGAVLEAIEIATGWDPRDAVVVVGTSAGAASAAELRAGLPAADLAARRAGTPFSAAGRQLLRGRGRPPRWAPVDVAVDEERSRSAFRRHLAPGALLAGRARVPMLVSAGLPTGTLSALWLAELVEWLGGGPDWPRRAVRYCAVDLESGGRTVFGALGAPATTPGRAVAASCAIPGTFAPVPIGGRLYVDGAAWSPTNADVLAGDGLDLVIVSSPMSAAPGSTGRTLDGRLRRLCHRVLAREVAVLRAAGTRVAVVAPVAAELALVGELMNGDLLDEQRCPPAVAGVRASVLARIRSGTIPGIEALAGPAPQVR